MDAPTSALEDELATLRRRAYGPDADIARDVGATARLHELEALRRPVVPHDPGSPPAPPTRVEHEDTVPDADPVAGRSEVDADSSAVPASDDGSDTIVPPMPAGRGPWWRRRGTWIVAGAAAVGLAIGYAVPLVSAPHPSAVLKVVGGPPSIAFSDDAVSQTLDYLGVRAATLRRLEKFGDIQAYIGSANQGTTCLLLSSARAGLTGGFYGVSCTPPGVDWVVDVRVNEGMTRDFPGRTLPVGSLLRFEGQGESVGLWITPAPAAAA